jgi:glycosyltransferase involved in cell wall biosynthesis
VLQEKAGFEKSSGDILYWIDADDYISPDLLEKTYFLFEEENADIVVYDIADDNNGKNQEGSLY